MNFNKIDTFILTNKRKKSLTQNHLQGLGYQIYENPDWDLPNKFKPKGVANLLSEVKKNQLGQFRCFRGHQEIWKLAKKDYILVFEDDAKPIKDDWMKTIYNSLELLNNHELISFNARPPKTGLKINKSIFHKGNKYIKINKSIHNLKWALGSLCYLVNRKSVLNKMDSQYTGIPIDLYIYNYLNSIILYPSCFEHDRSEGTLIGK